MLNHNEIVAQSEEFRKVMDLSRRVAESCANVLITGESGTGKEVIAQLIHESSRRKSRSFVALNCAAIPETLLESELFGHAKGAYTGAANGRSGLFEEAEGGTLFLDEIADLDVNLQAKLLRVIQDRKIRRVGENQYRPVNIRLISATHENLSQAVQNRTFREDLFFRLNVITIDIPALRHRPTDILPLANTFLRKYNAANEKGLAGFSKSAQEYLLRHEWPGNVRELENCVERAVVLSQNEFIQAEDLIWQQQPAVSGAVVETDRQIFDYLSRRFQKTLSMQELEHLYVQYVLDLNHGARDKTAHDLGMDRKTLYRKLQAWNLSPAETSYKN